MNTDEAYWRVWAAITMPTWHPESTYRIKPKVVKARAWKDAVEPGVSIVNSTQVNVVKAIEADIARGKTQWVSDWFEIPLTE